MFRIVEMVWTGFFEHRCPLHSAALTYVSLMSMVPILALMFSVSKGLGAQSFLMKAIADQLVSMPEQIQTFVNTIFGYVEKTNFSALGVMGLAFLFYTAVNVMAGIETTFNSIWGVKEARNFFRKFTDYTSVILIVPILLMLATSVSATLQSPMIMGFIHSHVGPFFSLYKSSIAWSSRVVIWIAFTVLFLFIPNRRVYIIPALIGGIVSGELWQLIQWAYVQFQVGVTRYNAIYGAFAIIPIFLVWLYLVWTVILLGAEVSFACQNFTTHVREHPETTPTSYRDREFLALWIALDVFRHFHYGYGKWSMWKFLEKNSVSKYLVKDTLDFLLKQKLIAKTSGLECFLPEKDLSTWTAADLCNLLEGSFILEKHAEKLPMLDRLLKLLLQGQKNREEVLSSISLLKLIDDKETLKS